MNLRKGTPGEGWQARADSFSYTKVAVGLSKTWNGWMAGEVYWCKAHEHTDALPGTKPCLDWMTEGALRCPRCKPHVLPTWVGYVPLYREVDHKPVVVIVHESVMDLVKGLKYGDFVLVGRADDKSSVFVRLSESPQMFRTDQEQRKQPCNLNASLLTMWQMPLLERWLLDARRETATAAQGKPDAVQMRLSVPPPTTAIEAIAIDAHRNPPSDWSELVGNVLNKAAQRGAKPSKNGHHKKAEEGEG